MKNIAFVLLLFFGTTQTFAFEIKKVRVGAGTWGATDMAGLGARAWIYDMIGLSLNIGSAYTRESEGGSLHFILKAPLKKKIRPYILLGAGLGRIDLEDVIPEKINVNVGFFTTGLGGEMLFGKSQRQAFSLETAYTYGKVEYSSRSQTYIGDQTQQSQAKTKHLTPFAIRLYYHFYILNRI